MLGSIHILQSFLYDNPNALEGHNVMKVVGNLQGSLVDLSPPLKDLCFTDYLQYLDFLNLNAASRIESRTEREFLVIFGVYLNESSANSNFKTARAIIGATQDDLGIYITRPLLSRILAFDTHNSCTLNPRVVAVSDYSIMIECPKVGFDRNVVQSR
ncbi:predicted protein [Sclerotinia sclerotiorum 1980 UF-70]|uniref:Uncharacterized protein n=1 Tax=Sclerotinia sclerotiorum (strain ATCC 18683 / 1980 / Ss-1) TaxID=665079 RepID=A7EIN6_SCLS1|nr:predicted protein [Sclerotinia sclerotiorum 1980 UF-70]EDO02702.1 predicted protein [Sclerotinia sclerotiorum 1980 UF-70]